MDLASVIYSFVKMLPGEERFAFADQMRRSVVSIPSNIAEGQSRGTPKEFAHFLRIAKGSTSELETQLLLCVKLGRSSRCAKRIGIVYGSRKNAKKFDADMPTK